MRLHRRGQLGDIVDAGQSMDFSVPDAEIGQASPVDSGILGRELPRFVIDDQDGECPVRMVGKERVGENPGVRKIVARDDRAGTQHGRWDRISSMAALQSDEFIDLRANVVAPTRRTSV